MIRLTRTPHLKSFGEQVSTQSKGAKLFEPTTFEDAIDGPDQVHWRKAICAGLGLMKLRGVFRATKLPTGQRTIGTTWVFKIKRKADGSVKKYKARLVAKGFKQKIWHRKQGDVLASGQLNDISHGDCNHEVL